jgi:protein-L-isoaspartate(D-aspartate) O-methyltransferase
MRNVPREAFLPDELAEFAYRDTPLPIEAGQTISQPYIVALMIESVEPRAGDRALEIGTGSGYAAAVLSKVVSEVYTVERHEQLAKLATSRLHGLGYSNVEVLHGDGTLGWQEHAPFRQTAFTRGVPGNSAIASRSGSLGAPHRKNHLLSLSATKVEDQAVRPVSDEVTWVVRLSCSPTQRVL